MSDTSVRLRNATAGDATHVVALLAELGYPTSATDFPDRLAAVLAHGGAVVVAVDVDDQMLGLLCLSRHVVLHAPGPVAYISALVTAQAARRRGVGQRLVAEAKAWARREGCVRLSVTSAEHRTDAHTFYPACGMPYTGRRFTADVEP
ncbi:MAG: GNAT family N-acetyltransferase [Gemmatimonadaceae bacterium]